MSGVFFTSKDFQTSPFLDRTEISLDVHRIHRTAIEEFLNDTTDNLREYTVMGKQGTLKSVKSATAAAEPSSISIFGLFNDFWLSTLSWIDISGVSQLSINVFLPQVQGAETHKAVIVLIGARPQLVSIARGELTKIPIQLSDVSTSRLGLDATSPEPAMQGDERQLGMKLVSIEIGERKIAAEDLYKLQPNGQHIVMN